MLINGCRCMFNILPWQNKNWQPYVCPHWIFLFYWAMKLKFLDQNCSRHCGSGFLLGTWQAPHDVLKAKMETGVGCRSCGGRVSWCQCFIMCHPDNRPHTFCATFITFQVLPHVVPSLSPPPHVLSSFWSLVSFSIYSPCTCSFLDICIWKF